MGRSPSCLEAAALALVALLGCGGAKPQPSLPAGGGSGGSAPEAGTDAAAEAGPASPTDGGVQDAGTDAGAVAYEPGPRIDTPLVDEPGTRDWQCGAARQPSALGISPWGSGKLVTGAQGLHLVRAQGPPTPDGSYPAAELVISSAGMDGVLGPDVILRAEPGFIHGVTHVGSRDSQAHVVYAVGPTRTDFSYFAQPLTDGKPDGAATRLTLNGYGVYGLSLEDSYLFLGRTGDPLDTDLGYNGRLWVQKVDVSGTAVGPAHTVVQASASRRMASLLAVQPVRTDTGFLVLYRWWDLIGDKIDISHSRRRFQALDKDGRAAGSAREFEPEIGTHIFNDPALTAHRGGVLAAWAEEERTPDPTSPTGFSLDPPAWTVIRVASFDDKGARIGPVRTVSPAPGARIWPELPYWIDLGGDDIGLGWYERETDYALCPACWAVGKNYFVVLSADLQSARSEVVSYELQTADAGFMARSAARFGDDILVIGDLARNVWSEAASATLRCTR